LPRKKLTMLLAPAPQRQGAELERSTTQSELATVMHRLDGIVDAIAGGLRAPALQRRLDELGARKKGA
jgi:hypothetical protein